MALIRPTGDCFGHITSACRRTTQIATRFVLPLMRGVRCSDEFAETMKPLSIVWQRLVNSDGQTCDRCGATYEELEQAIKKLETSLKPLGIEPTIEIREIDSASFARDPAQSNRTDACDPSRTETIQLGVRAHARDWRAHRLEQR